MNWHNLFLLTTIIIMFFSCKKNIPPTILSSSNIKTNYTTADSTIQLKFTAHDEDGTVQSFKLFLNDQLITESSDNILSFKLKDLQNYLGCNVLKISAFDNDFAEATLSKIISINDYRIKFLGNFDFYTTSITTQFADSVYYYDTTFHNGEIRTFEVQDSQQDYYHHDDSHENPHQKISINFSPYGNSKLTSIISIDGVLQPKYGSHYYHSGQFSDNLDTLVFNFHSGSLATTTYYKVLGIRNE